MSKKKRSRPAPRAEPVRRSIAFAGADLWESIECRGYVSLAQNPEICTAVDTIARLIASMTIHLMENTETGDIRVKNELSRKVDISPNNNMTRAAFIHWIVKTLMLEGNGNAVVWPETRRGILRDLKPVPPAFTAFVPEGVWDYRVVIDGKEYDPDDVLHFVLNPGSYYPWKGEGYRVALTDVANNLKQAATTEKSFMSSNWKPSIIVKVDALTDEFASAEGRSKLLHEYIDTAQASSPIRRTL